MRIERRSFKIINAKKPYKRVYWFQSWYSPIFIKSSSVEDTTNSCCITFEMRKDNQGKHYITLANILPPAPLDSHDVMTHAVNLNNDFTNNTLKALPNLYNQQVVILPSNDNLSNSFAYELQVDHNIPVRRLPIELNGINIDGLIHQAIKIVKKDKFYLRHHHERPNTLDLIDSNFINIINSYPDIESYSLAYAWAQGLVFAHRFLYILDDRKRSEKKSFDHGYGS